MKFETFCKRLQTIKALRDKVDNINDKITLAFSDDIVYNKFYADTFNKIEDMMTGDLARDWFDSITDINPEHPFEKESFIEDLDYIIYETEWCYDNTKQFWVDDDKEGYDCTVWNIFAFKENLLTHETKDTFEYPKFSFGDKNV